MRLRFFRTADLARHSADYKTSIGLGLYKLSHATLDARLDDAIKNGDPIFMLEFLYGADDLLCRFPTRCSLIKAALRHASNDDRPSIVYTGVVPPALLVRKKQGVFFRGLR